MQAKLVVPMYLQLFQNLGLKNRICEPKKIPSFNFAWLSLGKVLQRNSKPFERCYSLGFAKFFINPSLICHGGIKTLSVLLKKCVEYFSFQVHLISLSAILLLHSAVQ